MDIYGQKKSKIERTYPYLTHDTSCDVLVIGGGITGAITAYFLAKEGAHVILAEKNIVGYGSTSAASALLEYQLNVDMYRLEKMLGENATNRIYRLCLDAIDKLEKIDKNLSKNTGFKRQDAIYYTNKFMQKSAMSKEYLYRKNAGFNTYFIDSHSMLNLNSGILTKGASAIMNPYLFTQALCEELNDMPNVEVYENTRIDDIKPLVDGVLSRTNNKFKIVSTSVIFSSGYETLKYFDKAPVELYKTFTIVSKPLKELKNFDTSFTARDNLEPYHYLRFDTNGRILFGGEDVKLTERFNDLKYLNSVATDKYRRLENILQKTLYNISDIETEYCFNATQVMSKDSLPIIDEMPNMPNCFCNIGLGTNGILYSVIGANMLKNAVKGLYTKDMNMFRIDR